MSTSTEQSTEHKEAYLAETQKFWVAGVVTFSTDNENTELHYSVVDVDELTRLLREGHTVDALNSVGATPLMMAAAVGCEEAVQILVDAEADPTIEDSVSHCNCLHWAVRGKNLRCVQIIVEACPGIASSIDPRCGAPTKLFADLMGLTEIAEHLKTVDRTEYVLIDPYSFETLVANGTNDTFQANLVEGLVKAMLQHARKEEGTEEDKEEDKEDGKETDYELVGFYEIEVGEGAMRKAFHGNYLTGPRKGQRCVVKKWKDNAVFDRSFWEQEILGHAMVKLLVSQWNEENHINKKFVCTLPRRGVNCLKGVCECKEWVVVEDFIDGEYSKWNSNSGYFNGENLSVQAFSHWTYHQSGGRLVVCDLQGVRRVDSYHITDPAINSDKVRSFGEADVGPQFRDDFMRRHECNKFCKPEWLKPDGSFVDRLLSSFRERKPETKTSRHTLYAFQTETELMP